MTNKQIPTHYLYLDADEPDGVEHGITIQLTADGSIVSPLTLKMGNDYVPPEERGVIRVVGHRAYFGRTLEEIQWHIRDSYCAACPDSPPARAWLAHCARELALYGDGQ